MAVAIITFGATTLSAEDAYITTEVGIHSTVYTVHCDYINRDDSTPFYIVAPEQRLAAEKYLAELAVDLDLTEMATVAIGKRSIVAAPSNISPRTLSNEWTTFSADGCYCTAISHEDSGGRYYGFTIEFTKPNVTSDGSGGTAFNFKGVDIGNIPMGHVLAAVSASFTTYTVVTSYSGDDAGTYITDLANAIGLGHIHKHDIQRGSEGNRGTIKSYDVIAGDLSSLEPNTSMQTITDIFPESIDSSQEAAGVLKLTLKFVKTR